MSDATERHERWAATMSGHRDDATLVRAHRDSRAPYVPGPAPTREERERREADLLAPSATRGAGAGNRARPESPDEWRTCFERDRDRILHSTPFRRLAGKTQVFIFPEDHMRTRLTHALEVAQVARSVSRALGLNEALTEAIALGHDCGHGPGGHASEEALDPFVPGGFDHAPWGADVALAPLNLCAETLDGIRNHSWSRPAPTTAEGEVVSWADRIAYVCHDFEDALGTGVVTDDDLPTIVRERVGAGRGRQLGGFITALVTTTREAGVVGMDPATAEALAAFRALNYERIYLRRASREQATRVVEMLRALVDFYREAPELLPSDLGGDPLHRAVPYVAGMTDRFAVRQAVERLGWADDRLPSGVDR